MIFLCPAKAELRRPNGYILMSLWRTPAIRPASTSALHVAGTANYHAVSHAGRRSIAANVRTAWPNPTPLQ